MSFQDGDCKFTTTTYQVTKSDLKGKNHKRQNSLLSQIPIWQEAFVLYYDKTDCSKQDRCFSIEMVIDKKGKKTKQIGKKQTFMLDQFQNGSIFEKEIYFGSEDMLMH